MRYTVSTQARIRDVSVRPNESRSQAIPGGGRRKTPSWVARIQEAMDSTVSYSQEIAQYPPEYQEQIREALALENSPPEVEPIPVKEEDVDRVLGATRIVLEGERPQSLNKIYAGVHWRKRKEVVDRAKRLVWDKLGRKNLYRCRVDISVIVYFKSRPQDSSNIFKKPYEDALIGNLIEDDSPKYVRRSITESRIDKKNPRIEILVMPVREEIDSGE